MMISVTTNADMPKIAQDCIVLISGFIKNRIIKVMYADLVSVCHELVAKVNTSLMASEFPFFEGVMHTNLLPS